MNFGFDNADDLFDMVRQKGDDVLFTLGNGVTVTLADLQMSTLGQGDIRI